MLDFGAGYGLSISALLFNGAKYVIVDGEDWGTLRLLEQSHCASLYQSPLGCAKIYFPQLAYLPRYWIHIPHGYFGKFDPIEENI